MPEKDKNSQEGPDVRGNLIKVNVGGTINHLTLLMGKALDAVYM